MKRAILPSLSAFVLAALIGCEKPGTHTAQKPVVNEPEQSNAQNEANKNSTEDGQPITPGDSPQETQPDNLQKGIEQSLENASKNAKQAQDQFVQSMRKKLAELDKSIQSMSNGAQQFSKEKQEEWKKTLDNLKQERDKLSEKLDAVGKASGQAWTEMTQGVNSAWSDLERAANKAKDKFTSEMVQLNDAKKGESEQPDGGEKNGTKAEEKANDG